MRLEGGIAVFWPVFQNPIDSYLQGGRDLRNVGDVALGQNHNVPQSDWSQDDYRVNAVASLTQPKGYYPY